MPDATLFHGIAVVIDDEINDPAASVKEIRKSIEDAGCHVIPFAGIPSDLGIANLKEVAFVVLDWKLYGTIVRQDAGGEQVMIPAGVEQANEDSIVKFLRDLKKIRFAPVFIFTDEPVEGIKEKLKNYADLYDEADPSHILVMDKTQVSKQGVFSVLSDWMKLAPSVFVLKSWERAYEKAKNKLFNDFYVKSTMWPMVIWETFKDDGVPPAILLGDLIGRNLASRMSPFECNLEPFSEMFAEVKANEALYKTTVRRVLEGERFLAEDQLAKTSVEPGDIFEVDDGYRINLRPDCDCIPRGGDTLERIELYLLKGTERTFADLEYDAEFGLIPEQDNEAIVFPVHDGKALCFKFRRLYIQKYRDLKGKRVGRLLPPFLTRLQQRYAAYMQRPGISRLPTAAFPAAPAGTTIPTIETVPAEQREETKVEAAVPEPAQPAMPMDELKPIEPAPARPENPPPPQELEKKD